MSIPPKIFHAFKHVFRVSLLCLSIKKIVRVSSLSLSPSPSLQIVARVSSVPLHPSVVSIPLSRALSVPVINIAAQTLHILSALPPYLSRPLPLVLFVSPSASSSPSRKERERVIEIRAQTLHIGSCPPRGSTPFSSRGVAVCCTFSPALSHSLSRILASPLSFSLSLLVSAIRLFSRRAHSISLVSLSFSLSRSLSLVLSLCGHDELPVVYRA